MVQLIAVVLVLTAFSVFFRYTLFDESFEYRGPSSKKGKKKKKRKKTIKIEELLRDSGARVSLKKFRTIQAALSIALGVYGWYCTGWIFGVIPGYLIGSTLSMMPLRIAAGAKNSSWDEQILMFVQNMISELSMSGGAITKSVHSASATVSEPLKGKLSIILAEYHTNGAKIGDGFDRLHRLTGKRAFLMIREALSTPAQIGQSAVTNSFERLYTILRKQRSARVERDKELSAYGVFARIFGFAALLSPIILKMALGSDFAFSDQGVIAKVCTTIGLFGSLAVFLITDRLDRSDDLN